MQAACQGNYRTHKGFANQGASMQAGRHGQHANGAGTEKCFFFSNGENMVSAFASSFCIQMMYTVFIIRLFTTAYKSNTKDQT
jgi:hypothetical protein